MRTILIVLAVFVFSGCSSKQEVTPVISGDDTAKQEVTPIVVSEGTIMVRFVDLSGALSQMLENAVRELYLTDPETAEIVEELVDEFDSDKIAVYVGGFIDKELTDKERQEIRLYAADPSFARVAELYRRYKDTDELVRQARILPEQDKLRFEAFTKSSAWPKVLRIVSSSGTESQLVDYFNSKKCDLVLRKADLHLYAAMIQKGQCPSDGQ